MRKLIVSVLTLIVSLIFLTCVVNGDSPEKGDAVERASLELSKKLQRLLSAEMNAVQNGMTNLSIAIPAGNWESIAETARFMADGYIMDNKLSKTEMDDFLTSLPAEYLRIDRGYKLLVEDMIGAAKKRDAEAVNSSFYRLNGTCIECHLKFAEERFPGFKQKEGKR